MRAATLILCAVAILGVIVSIAYAVRADRKADRPSAYTTVSYTDGAGFTAVAESNDADLAALEVRRAVDTFRARCPGHDDKEDGDA